MLYVWYIYEMFSWNIFQIDISSSNFRLRYIYFPTKKMYKLQELELSDWLIITVQIYIFINIIIQLKKWELYRSYLSTSDNEIELQIERRLEFLKHVTR